MGQYSKPALELLCDQIRRDSPNLDKGVYANLGTHLTDAANVATCVTGTPEVLNAANALTASLNVNHVLELIP